MARRKNLPLGWASRGITRVRDTGFYPDAVVRDIARKFSVEGAEAESALKQRLESAGTSYQAWKHNTAGPAPRAVRAYFQAVIDRSSELIDLIEKADDRSWQFIWRTEHQLQWDAIHSGDTRLADIGVLRPGNENDPAGTVAVYTDLGETLKHLRYIELLAQECLGQVQLRSPGQRRNQALYWWVYNMSAFWEKLTGKELAVTYYRKVPTSEAGQFLEACLAPMDREAVERLVSQMRAVQDDRKRPTEKK